MSVRRLSAAILLSASAILAWSADDAAITPPAAIELFNGKDLTGWVSFPAKAVADGIWTIQDGAIRCVGRPSGYLRTGKTYRDYRVTVEWKFLKPGNTGVCVHMNAPEKVWPNCVECQGMHKHQGDFWFQGGATCNEPRTMGKTGIPMKAKDAEKPVGEWNTYQVVCQGDTVTIIVNGQEMNKATACSVTSGWIGLQSEGAEILVRKVLLEPLHGAGAP